MDTRGSPQHKVEAPLLIIGALVLLTVGVSLLPASWLGIKKEVVHYQPLNLGSLAEYGTGESDTNQDGTVSWKEYISQGLNLTPDQATSSVDVDPRDAAALNDPNNLTTSFTKNLFIASTALKQSGITDQTTEQNTIDQLIKKEADKITTPTYTESSLHIDESSSPAMLKAYGNAIGSILNGILTKESISGEILSVNSFVQSENEGDLLPIVKDSAKVDAALDKLLALKVPRIAVQAHLTLLNKLGAYGSTLDNISRAYDDPIRATLAFRSYIDTTTSALQLFATLNSFFMSHSIVFTTKEAGYLFTRYTTSNPK